jgi:hypothetical protein
MKRKNLGMLLAVMLTSAIISAQNDYTVIRVTGNILMKLSGKALSQGSNFSDKDEFVFKTDDSRAAVIHPSKGRFILSPSAPGNNGSKSNLLPAMSNASTRGGAILNQVDLQNHFTGKYLIIRKIGVKIGGDAFPITDSSCFFIRYKYQGEDINKKLNSHGDTLIIDHSELMMVDSKPIPDPDSPDMKLYFRQGSKSILISEFTPIFPDEAVLVKEITTLFNGMNGKSKEDKIAEAISYMNDFYGKPDKDNVTWWLKEKFGF